MGRSAAIFDLDRTLLAGGSGPVFSDAFDRLGVHRPRIPGQGLFFKLYELTGESLVVMQLAKQAAGRARGLERARVQDVARDAAAVLEARIQPYVRSVLDEHRAAGQLLVMATTSPFDLVSPLAERLGFDAVVATRYAESEGFYTGEIDGEFVWGFGKLRAVRAWAERNDVDLAASTAYSDSVFDYPLLSGVGHAVAVNPDARLLALAALRRWPIRHLDAPPGVLKLAGVEPFDVLRWVARPELFPYARFRFEGLEHIPARGAAIVAANHRSYFDPVALGLAVMRAGRNARFMGKKEVFDAPVVGSLATLMGGIRVDRGTGSERPLREAAAALSGGEVVAMMPQGTIPRGAAFFDPVLVGRTGVARLAHMSGAAVIPVGIWGTERVWPRSAKVPNVWNVARPPEVTVRIGEPVTGLRGKNATADTSRIMAAIMALLPEEAHRPYEPSEEEIARANPGGRP